MKNVLLYLFFALINMNVIWGQSLQLTSFENLLNALKSGNSVRAVIEYGKCKLVINEKEEKSPEAIGGMDIKTFEYFARGSIKNNKAFISSSETILISHPKYGYVYNYIKIRVYEDNAVEITARYLDPKTFDVKMDETFYTLINDGSNNEAISFYIK